MNVDNSNIGKVRILENLYSSQDYQINIIKY
jgi:hypothetical protein